MTKIVVPLQCYTNEYTVTRSVHRSATHCIKGDWLEKVYRFTASNTSSHEGKLRPVNVYISNISITKD